MSKAATPIGVVTAGRAAVQVAVVELQRRFVRVRLVHEPTACLDPAALRQLIRHLESAARMAWDGSDDEQAAEPAPVVPRPRRDAQEPPRRPGVPMGRKRVAP